MVWPAGVYLLDFFYSGIQLYLVHTVGSLSLFYLLLYLDLYLLGDDTLIS